MPTQDAQDVLIRHQVMLEGYKNHEARGFVTYEDAIIGAIIASFGRRLTTGNLADVPKRELRVATSGFNKRIKRIIGQIERDKLRSVRRFAGVEKRMLVKEFEAIAGRRIPKVDAKAVTSRAINDVVPGAGFTARDMVKRFANSVKVNLQKTINRAKAEKWDYAELLKALTAEKSINGREGVLRKLAREFRFMSETLVQHISSHIGAFMGGLVADRYQWLSILDSRTSDICRSRHNRIYEYGKGPHPPAHYNCRSRTVPLLGEAFEPVGWLTWFRNQPRPFQNQAFGPAYARRLREAGAGATARDKFANTRTRNLEQYEATLPAIIGST